MKKDELPIIQKTYDLIKWYVPIVNRLPRDHKFARSHAPAWERHVGRSASRLPLSGRSSVPTPERRNEQNPQKRLAYVVLKIW
jgi:hypothetical protein